MKLRNCEHISFLFTLLNVSLLLGLNWNYAEKQILFTSYSLYAAEYK